MGGGCECEPLNGLLKIDYNYFMMMMTRHLLSWIQKMTVQHFALEV